MLVLGTSAEVFPASDIPRAARDRGARVIEVNVAPTRLTGTILDLTLLGSTTEVIPRLVDALLAREVASAAEGPAPSETA